MSVEFVVKCLQCNKTSRVLFTDYYPLEKFKEIYRCSCGSDKIQILEIKKL